MNSSAERANGDYILVNRGAGHQRVAMPIYEEVPAVEPAPRRIDNKTLALMGLLGVVSVVACRGIMLASEPQCLLTIDNIFKCLIPSF